MAKIDLTQTIIGLDGKPLNSTKEAFVIIRDRITQKEEFWQQDGRDVVIVRETPDEALTLKKQLINVLLTPAQAHTPEDKAKRYALFFRIENCKDNKIDMTAEEISLCKMCNNEFSNILVAGRANSLLEGGK